MNKTEAELEIEQYKSTRTARDKENNKWFKISAWTLFTGIALSTSLTVFVIGQAKNNQQNVYLQAISNNIYSSN